MLSSDSAILPWQQQAWHKLVNVHAQKQLPHALLLTGPDGSGKQRFATALAQMMLCLQPNHGKACGECASCMLEQGDTHPDLIQLSALKEAIKIDQVRAVIESLQQTTYFNHRVVLILGADRLSTACANSLLKSLEEPPANTLFVLTASSRWQVLATVRSRCQLHHLYPTAKHFNQWLQQKWPQVTSSEASLLQLFWGSAPLTLQQQMQDHQTPSSLLEHYYNQRLQHWFTVLDHNPVVSAERLLKLDIDHILSAWALFCQLLLKASFMPQVVSKLVEMNQAFGHRFGVCAEHVDRLQLLDFYQNLSETILARHRGVALNETLLLEAHLAEWQTLLAA